MNKTKILFVIYSIYGGGAEKQMQYILKYIDRTRFQPYLCVFKLTGKETEVVPPDVPVYNLNTKLSPASVFLIVKLIQLINKINPDCILTFMWSVNLISSIAGLLTGTKIFVGERTYTPADVSGLRLNWIIKKLITILYSQTKKTVAVSSEVREGLINYFKLNESKIVVINNGIDLQKATNLATEYVPEINNYILACGNLEKIKNHEFLIETIAKYRSQLNLPLVILGDGSEKKYLEEKAKQLSVNLILKGYIDNPYPWLKNAKVLVLTSKYEGFPNVILEAMALGVPVVTVDSPGGIRNVVTNGEDGIITPMNDKEALSQAIIKIIEATQLSQKLIDNAARKVKKFSVEEMVHHYETLFREN